MKAEWFDDRPFKPVPIPDDLEDIKEEDEPSDLEIINEKLDMILDNMERQMRPQTNGWWWLAFGVVLALMI